MADLVELLHAIQGTAEAAEDAGLADRGVALREIEELATEALAALTASPAGDDPKAGLPQPIASGASAGWMPKVKALEWKETWSGGQEDIPSWRAKNPFGLLVSFSFAGETVNGRRVKGHSEVPPAVLAERKAQAEATYSARVLAALDLPPSVDDPKALDAAARSSSTEAVEQEVERLRYILFLFREFWFQNVTQTKIGSGHHHPMWQAVAEALGPMNRDGTTPEEWQFITGSDKPFPSRPSPVPAACKPEGAPSFPGKEEGRG